MNDNSSRIENLLKEVFLRNLREARKKSGLSQKEVAAKLGKHQSYIAKSESGERKLSPVEIFFLSKIYGVEVNYFFRGMEEIKIWEKEEKKK